MAFTEGAAVCAVQSLMDVCLQMERIIQDWQRAAWKGLFSDKRFEAQAVAYPMKEALAVPARLDNTASRGVNVAGRDTGTHGLDRRVMGLQDQLVDLEVLGAWLADDRHAGGVCLVTVEGRAEIQEREITGGKRATRGFRVRKRGIWPRLHKRLK